MGKNMPLVWRFITKIKHILLSIQVMTTAQADVTQQKPKEEFGLNYEPCETEGECLLESITPVYRSTPRFALYIILCICLVGIPLLITYWYPWLKRTLYFRACSLAEATHFHVINYDEISTYPEKEHKIFYTTAQKFQEAIFFKNRYLTYLVENETVRAAQFNFIQRLNDLMGSENPQKKSYVPDKDDVNLIESYGPGVMIIDMPSVPMLFFQEVMRPLYLFILFSCGLWIYELYYYYSGVIFVTAAIGIITNLVQTYQNNKKIFEMAYNEEMIETLRGGEIQTISSTKLAPGDIVFLKKQIKIPFDGIILEGEALINQCALTGQSVPILKKPEKVAKKSDLKSSYIYEGTSLIQVGNKKKMLKFEPYRQKYGVPLIVSRTNFSTMKGQLIRVISFPRERENIFERQSSKFLIFLFCLSCASYGILLSKLVHYASAQTLVVKFLDLITITVPPGLPVSMTFGIIFALEKLKDKKIFCSSPNKVIHGGLTNWLCFDKTGTLTQDFMDFNCLVLYEGTKFADPILNHQILNKEGEGMGGNEGHLNKIIQKHKTIHLALNNMAMNHTIVNVEQTGENVGDPMEIKLFEFGEFKFSNEQSDRADIIMAFDSHRGHKGFVYKRFDFDSQLFRMSAIGKSTTTADDFYLYIKGSPEMMLEIFKKSTLPSNYGEVLKQYASQGFRVLAIGSKKIEANAINSPRLDLEKEINFEGFEVFENRLKPETKGAIKNLVESELPCVMITGDNALTGSNMACQCGISDPTKITLICNYNPQKNQFIMEEFKYKPEDASELSHHRKQNTGADDINLEEITNQPANLKIQNTAMVESLQHMNLDAEKDRNLIIARLKDPNIQLCLTGPALNRIFDSQENLTAKEKYILLKTTVFARAKPNDKIKAIALYQKLGKRVSMCGDGANDCGALKQADIGLSLSMAQASISAPFTSQITNINSMVELLKECRAGLATNFSLFNIMALYSLIQYSTTIISQFYFSYPWDFQYLYWDIFCNFLFFLTIGYTGTADKLSVEIPNGSLFTISNITQVLVMFGFQLSGQILMIVGLTQYFTTPMNYSPEVTYQLFVEGENTFVLDSFENNALFLFSNIMYISTLLAFSISKPWRKGFYTNPLFMIVLVLMLSYSLVMIVVPGARLEIFKISYLNYQPYNWYIFGLAVGISVLLYVVQKFILEPFFNWLKQKYPDKTWL